MAFRETRIQAVLKIGLCCGEFSAADFSLVAAGNTAKLISFKHVDVCLVDLPEDDTGLVFYYSRKKV